MALVKLIILFILIGIYILLSLVLHLVWFLIRRFNLFRALSIMTSFVSKILKFLFNLKIKIKGQPSLFKQRGILVISNHLTYLDGVVLASLIPVVFVTKKQVRSWPVFGWLTRVSGTVYIDRQRKLLSGKYIKDIVNIIKRGVNILIFPEGTSTNGEDIRQFQSVFFQAAIICGCSILPLTINYSRVNQEGLSTSNRDTIFWYGQTKFTRHILMALRLKQIEVEVTVHSPVKAQFSQDSPLNRKKLGEALRGVIKEDYQVIRK
jgi:1-acyl-sn-glycerol-3-phosphate acyltransferase